MKRKSLRLVATAFIGLFLAGAAGLTAAERLPQPDKIVLKNGLTIYHLKNSSVPMVSFRMLINGAGTAYEPAELEGLAGITANLAMKGTSTMGADALAEALDFMGAGLEMKASTEYSQVTGESLTEHFPRLLEIAAACLTDPAFNDDEFAKEQAQLIDGIKSVKDNPARAVGYYFQKAYFGSNPLGRLDSGTESSLKKITNAAVRDFFRSRWLPDRAVAAVVGDIDRDKLVALAESTLGKWKQRPGSGAVKNLPVPPTIKGRKLVLIDKPDANQAYFILGGPGYAMGDPVSAPAAVMNTLWGGRFTSWINSELRIKRGLTYGAGSSVIQWRSGGIFMASSYTKNDKIGEMLDITFDLLGKASRPGFSAEEIESGRNYILGQFPPTLETNGSKASAYVRLAFYDLGFDYYDNYLGEIKDIGKDKVDMAAEELMPAKEYVLVVVGKAAEIREQLKKFGTWQEKKITDPDF